MSAANARGGSYLSPHLYAGDRVGYWFPDYEWWNIGLRVAEVPEPATLSLLAIGGLALLRRNR